MVAMYLIIEALGGIAGAQDGVFVRTISSLPSCPVSTNATHDPRDYGAVYATLVADLYWGAALPSSHSRKRI